MADSVEKQETIGDIREWRSIVTLIVFVVTSESSFSPLHASLTLR